MDNISNTTGGAYIPPSKLKLMQERITDKSSEAYQKLAWDALKKTINGLINKVNVDNFNIIVKKLLSENVIRGRGILARTIIVAQSESPALTHVHAALVAVINSKFPQIGILIVNRLLNDFHKSYRRNDKKRCLTCSRFFAHLLNQDVVDYVIIMELLFLLLDKTSNNSVEIAVGIMKEVGQKLEEISKPVIMALFDKFRFLLNEGTLDKRVNYMIEVLFQIRKDKYKDYPIVVEGLNLVDPDDQTTHVVDLLTEGDIHDELNVFQLDNDFLENERKYEEMKEQILPESEEEEEDDEENEEANDTPATTVEIQDQSFLTQIELRKKIYLKLHSALTHMDAAHLLLQIPLKPEQLYDMASMILDCCAQLRIYDNKFGYLAQQMSLVNHKYVEEFEKLFCETYSGVHRLDMTKIRNLAMFFGHLLCTDTVSWGILIVVKITEKDTTSSGRIFLKHMFNEMRSTLGIKTLIERFREEPMQIYFENIFPKDDLKETRFAINFFTAIDLGAVTEDMRKFFEEAKKARLKEGTKKDKKNESDSSSSSDGSSSSDSDSDDSSSDVQSTKKTAAKKQSRGDERKMEDEKSGRKGHKNNDDESKRSRNTDNSGRKEPRSKEDTRPIDRMDVDRRQVDIDRDNARDKDQTSRSGFHGSSKNVRENSNEYRARFEYNYRRDDRRMPLQSRQEERLDDRRDNRQRNDFGERQYQQITERTDNFENQRNYHENSKGRKDYDKGKNDGKSNQEELRKDEEKIRDLAYDRRTNLIRDCGNETRNIQSDFRRSDRNTKRSNDRNMEPSERKGDDQNKKRSDDRRDDLNIERTERRRDDRNTDRTERRRDDRNIDRTERRREDRNTDRTERQGDDRRNDRNIERTKRQRDDGNIDRTERQGDDRRDDRNIERTERRREDRNFERTERRRDDRNTKPSDDGTKANNSNGNDDISRIDNVGDGEKQKNNEQTEMPVTADNLNSVDIDINSTILKNEILLPENVEGKSDCSKVIDTEIAVKAEKIERKRSSDSSSSSRDSSSSSSSDTDSSGNIEHRGGNRKRRRSRSDSSDSDQSRKSTKQKKTAQKRSFVATTASANDEVSRMRKRRSSFVSSPSSSDSEASPRRKAARN